MALRIANKWVVLGTDLLIIAVSFFLAYLIRFNMAMNFDISKLLTQLPVVVMIALVVCLIIGSHKGAHSLPSTHNLGNIFKAIGLLTMFIFVVFLITQKWSAYSEFGLPISILILFSLLSLAGLTASRFIFRALHNAFA